MPTSPRNNPIFPLDLGLLGPAQVLAYANAAELGALVLLARAAWTEEPPGTLPAGDEHLARLCGRMDDAAWKDVRAVVLRCWQAGEDGRLHNAELQAAHAAMLDAAERRRARTSRASEARWADRDASVTPPLRIRDGSATEAPRTLRALSAPRSCAPKLLMNSNAPGSLLSAQGHPASPRSAGAGATEPPAGNPMLEQLRRTEQRIVRQLLEAARWEWAGRRHSQLPPNVIDRLVVHPNATVRQVEWALSWARELQADADAQAQGRNPIGRVIGCIEKPVLPPLIWSQDYDARQDRRDRELDRLRARALALGPSGAAAGGAS